jgi:hypothetical protein
MVPSGSTGSVVGRRRNDLGALLSSSTLCWASTLLVFYAITGCATVNPQASALVEYRRSGGIMGRDDQLVVNADGTAHLTHRGTELDFTIGTDSLAQLRSLLESIEFPSLREEYLPPRTGADLFEYVVIYRGRKIRMMDTAIPAELQPLIVFLNGLADKRR